MQETFTEPGTLTVDDVGLQLRFVEFVVTVRLTVPVNPLIAPIVMFEVPVNVALTVMLAGFAEIEKSGTGAVMWYVTVALCDNVPLVPVTLAW